MATRPLWPYECKDRKCSATKSQSRALSRSSRDPRRCEITRYIRIVKKMAIKWSKIPQKMTLYRSGGHAAEALVSVSSSSEAASVHSGQSCRSLFQLPLPLPWRLGIRLLTNLSRCRSLSPSLSLSTKAFDFSFLCFLFRPLTNLCFLYKFMCVCASSQTLSLFVLHSVCLSL